MNGFHSKGQRIRACNVLASWLESSGCGFELMSDFGPSREAKISARTLMRPDGGGLSPGQVVLLKLLLDLWSPGLGGCSVVDLDLLDERHHSAIGLLIVALASSQAESWISTQEVLTTSAQSGIKRQTRMEGNHGPKKRP